jgi:hypothetical protein
MENKINGYTIKFSNKSYDKKLYKDLKTINLAIINEKDDDEDFFKDLFFLNSKNEEIENESDSRILKINKKKFIT